MDNNNTIAVEDYSQYTVGEFSENDLLFETDMNVQNKLLTASQNSQYEASREVSDQSSSPQLSRSLICFKCQAEKAAKNKAYEEELAKEKPYEEVLAKADATNVSPTAPSKWKKVLEKKVYHGASVLNILKNVLYNVSLVTSFGNGIIVHHQII